MRRIVKWIGARLQRKTMAALTAMMILPLAILGTFIYLYSYWTIERDYINNSKKYLNQVSQNIEHNIKSLEMISILAFMDEDVINVLRMDRSGNSENTPYKQNIMGSFLTKLKELRNDVNGIYIFSGSNVYYKSKQDETIDSDYDYKNDFWYKETVNLKGATYVIGTHIPFQKKHSNYYVYSIARSIIDYQTGNHLGVILIDALLDGISNMAEVEKVFDGSWLVITDNQGKIIFSPDRKEITKSLELSRNDFLNDVSGYFFTKEKEEELLVNYVTSEYTGWKMLQFIPSETVYNASRTIGLALILLAGLLIFLSVLISFYVSIKISKPIIDINSILQRIGEGNFDWDLKIKGNDEVSQLMLGIKKMSIRLKALLKRVTTARLKQKEAELKFLQSQINPHFLHNTLNSIQMMAIINGQVDMAHMIDDLGKFYKSGIFQGNDMVKIREEVDHVRLYLKILQMRYGDKLKWTININEVIMELYTAKFILQPIVENAIYHGIEPNLYPGEIRIEGKLKDDCVEICIEDSGVGISEDKLEGILLSLSGEKQLDTQMNSIGIKNVNDRIKLYFGNRYGLSIFSQKGKGTRVLIKIPVLHRPVPLANKYFF
ncbi:MAG TPA: sensor histidine kinase [Clostridiaceae bacterium]|nr:sensor histidine kinase [Clostridiaceae bacterium]